MSITVAMRGNTFAAPSGEAPGERTYKETIKTRVYFKAERGFETWLESASGLRRISP
jgi:hypothetical protein